MTAITESTMINEQHPAGQHDTSVQRKKVSWFGTILWMLGMIVLFNIVAGIVVYVAWMFMK